MREDLETQEKFKPTESKLCWESARGLEERLTTEFWTREDMGRSEICEWKRDENFLFKIILWW